MPATIITIANQKGGVGKTATAINLGAALAARGVRTLLLDMDPQANATSGLGLEKMADGSIYDPLHGDGDAAEKVVPTGIKNLSIIPSEVDLAAIEIELAQKPDYLIQLSNCLDSLKNSDKFGVILIDCPPALGLLSMNSLAAADYLLIALQCEYLAMEGLGQILTVVDKLREAGASPNLELGGIAMTMYDMRTNLSRQVVEEVRKHFGDMVFKTVIPRTIRLGEAPSFGQTIFQYDALNPSASAYKNLAGEVRKRFSL